MTRTASILAIATTTLATTTLALAMIACTYDGATSAQTENVGKPIPTVTVPMRIEVPAPEATPIPTMTVPVTIVVPDPCKGVTGQCVPAYIEVPPPSAVAER